MDSSLLQKMLGRGVVPRLELVVLMPKRVVIRAHHATEGGEGGFCLKRGRVYEFAGVDAALAWVFAALGQAPVPELDLVVEARAQRILAGARFGATDVMPMAMGLQ